MNMVLWVLQILLALYYLMGGFYMLNAGKLPKPWLKKLPAGAWMAIGLLQALAALGLVLPSALSSLPPNLIQISAGCLILVTLSVAFLSNVKKFAGWIWVLLPGALAAWVAWSRMPQVPMI